MMIDSMIRRAVVLTGIVVVIVVVATAVCKVSTVQLIDGGLGILVRVAVVVHVVVSQFADGRRGLVGWRRVPGWLEDRQ